MQKVGTECGNLDFPRALPISPQQAIKHILTFSDCVHKERETRGQTNNPKWFKESRLTLSNFGKILKIKSITKTYELFD